MLEALLEIFGEAVLTVVLEAMAEYGWDAVSAPFRRDAHPVLAAIGWALFGALAGGISLLVAPHNLLHGAWRIANVFCTPVAVAIAAHTVHLLRMPATAAPAGNAVRKPCYAFVFALAVALVRFNAA